MDLDVMIQIDVEKTIEGQEETHKAILANDDDNLLLIYGFGTDSQVIHSIPHHKIFKLMTIDCIYPGDVYGQLVKELQDELLE